MALPAVLPDTLAVFREQTRVLAHERTLPVTASLVSVLPDAVLVRGQVVAVRGVADLSLALALASASTRDGSWLAVVERAGVLELGGGAAGELGVVLARTVVVSLSHDPSTSSAEATVADVMAALVEGFDIVIVPAALALGHRALRRLQARLRTRGGVVVVVGGAGGWEVDLTLWSSPADELGGWEHFDELGRFVRRQVFVDVEARRRGRVQRHHLWLPE